MTGILPRKSFSTMHFADSLMNIAWGEKERLRKILKEQLAKQI